jgi:hypothetical protein
MKTLRRTTLGLASLSLVFASPLGWPQTFTVPNTFVTGTPASAADVNANFSATAAAVNGKQNLVTGTCPAGQSIRAINANGSVVCQLLSFFGGDGSAGTLTVGTQSWSATPPVNPNFANITINAGQTLTVPAGTTIRCSGTFTNAGTLNVDPGATSDGNFDALASSPNGPAVFVTSVAHPGDTPGTATLGEQNNVGLANTQALGGGTGGKAIPRAVAQTSFGNFRFGGGSGAGYDNQGNRGGGLVKIYCEGAIVNTGTINARGEAGGNSTIAGGGGGIVVLASRTSVSNSGTINANGGNGAGSSSWGGNAGGGGGGIVIMVSPIAPTLGTINVAGGTGGTSTTSVTAGARVGGSGGGGSGGAGGDGGDVSSATTGIVNNAADGGVGYAMTMTLDPLTIAR